MYSIDNVLISEDLLEAQFKCSLDKCKGACCVNGEKGAPVTTEEIEAIEQSLAAVMPYLPAQNKAVLNRDGVAEFFEGNWYLTCIEGRECAFATVDAAGIATCNLERAYLDSKTNFQKPISCHLFPIRVRGRFGLDYLEYMQIDEWRSGRGCGMSESIYLYEYLQTPLVRKYGQSWYEKFAAFCKQKLNPTKV
jgi:hypothetical protein